MQSPRISAIAAIGRNRELGKNNDLIWRIPADLKRLRELTTGHPLIMGRKTYESIGRPLPNRTNIVISRDADYSAPGCTVVTSLATALETARAIEETEIFIFGGAAIYQEALPYTDTLYLTVVDATDPAADTFFPDVTEEFVATKKSDVYEHDGISYQLITYTRKSVQ